MDSLFYPGDVRGYLKSVVGSRSAVPVSPASSPDRADSRQDVQTIRRLDIIGRRPDGGREESCSQPNLCGSTGTPRGNVQSGVLLSSGTARAR